jgi:hypothetical protein
MRLALMMLDGLTIAGAVHVVGLGVSTEGLNVPAGVQPGTRPRPGNGSQTLLTAVDPTKTTCSCPTAPTR